MEKAKIGTTASTKVAKVNFIAKKRSVGLAYPAFESSFRRFYPDLKIISDPSTARNFDLVIFSGGEDVDPKYYGQTNTMSYGVNSRRDAHEMDVFQNIYDKSRIKILGVCRGHQLIQVALGGRLYQDFPSSINQSTGTFFEYHSSPHTLTFLSAGTVVQTFFQGKLVSSLHHQAVVENNIYSLSNICLYKGIVEASESKNIITVQFHPEFDWQPGNHCDDFFKFLVNEW
jgi:putative glutamine amidotransferase